MNIPRVRFVSGNPGKVREVRAILAGYGIELSWLRRSMPEPQADTLDEVVAAKVASLPRGPGCYLVEDSGLFLDGLAGFPGVYSAYVYRTLGLAGVLRALGPRSRDATFQTVAGVRWGARTWWGHGRVRGTIARSPRGGGGFGYDPIFIATGERRTFAEMTAEEKDHLSHRGRAVRSVLRAMGVRGSSARALDRRPKEY